MLPGDLSLERLNNRMALATTFNRMRDDLDRYPSADHMGAHYKQALHVLTGQRMQQAFALDREPPSVRSAYGEHAVGQGLLLARRLVEAGVTYIVVNTGQGGSWDTHSNNFNQLKSALLPPMDQGVVALVQDLDQRGQLDDVLVLVAGEMGRSPVVNASAGRDHWTAAYSVFLAGGGLTRGQVLGSTTPDGRHPHSHPATVHDILATLYGQLGVDWQAVLRHSEGRPSSILPEGQPIAELIG
jgi:uncharacterized protein (DUF1501 family)